MTRISPTLYPDRTLATPPHGTICRSDNGAVTSVSVNRCAPEAVPPQPQREKGPQTISDAFERMNAPQMQRDRLSALPPLSLIVIWGLTLLAVLGAADAAYSSFFEWMVM